ncbi:hypothetical protein POTOM_031058 [Populus tomentosa]|uniref:Dirigent protein n=1 Tax=Populus tomentosa TaxID=118781 RepID=A0A8X7ZHW7_POPTO|nr:hypothetical protein POTOM_031058 [Populus tomentosa]
MAKPLVVTTTALKAIVYLFLIAMTLSYANSARILDELEPENPAVVSPPATTTVPAPTTTSPSGQVQATTPTTVEDDEADPPLPDETEAPVTVAAPLPVGPINTATRPPNGPAPVVATSDTEAKPAGPQTTTTTSPPLSFFMHDILGGSHASNRIVTGIIARTDINGIRFSQPNNNIFPLQGGTPLVNINNLINPNTAPLLTGLTGAQTNTLLQNTGNNNNVVNSNNQPFVTAGNLPAGSALQKLMFGSITVVDDELTEGHELGSDVIGKAQGFYLASSLDGTSHTMAFSVLLHEGENHGEIEDTISFFGVHRTATPDSQIAVIGGTGKYENAKGYASVETLPQVDQHTTDGVDTIMHFSVYLSECMSVCMDVFLVGIVLLACQRPSPSSALSEADVERTASDSD